ncbi:MAG TPA: hypothetical protein VFA09_05840 [Ktedonobacteraceae bacterium]|jgi:hypothetical protein|nr:hypothetical protein [Ktedonobacteraceae bacterium]
MATELRVKTVVLPGGKIEISTPQLIPGQEATVIVTCMLFVTNDGAFRRVSDLTVAVLREIP